MGTNTLVVRVTAEDTTTMKDHTRSPVTRRVAPSSTPIWSATLTVKEDGSKLTRLFQLRDRLRVQFDLGADGRRLHRLGHGLGDNV